MMFARGGPMMMLFLLNNPQVQQELKLTEEQRDKVSALSEQLREKFRGLGQELRGLSPEEREKRVQAVNEEVEKELAKVLKKEQLQRLKQIALQVEGLAALARPEIAKQVGLTEEQQRKIEEILREANEKRRALFQQGPPADRQAMFREMQKIREWVDEQISKLLTEQQKKKWQELIGEPFKLEFRPFGGPRGQ
jgi:DNA-binding MarR family transcriptional regulator